MSTEQEILSIPTSHQHPSDDDIIFPQITPFALALEDFYKGMENWRIWFMLAYQDIKLRYRRSLLGPFWITLSMAITVYSMGYLYGHIFHDDLSKYYPFLVAGMLSWSLISQIILDTSEGFMTADVYIKQVKLPYSLYIHRLCARNMIIFFHNLLVMIPIYFIFFKEVTLSLNMLLLLPGLIIIYFNALIFGTIFAMIGARYRDIAQITKSLVQVIFFITPVLWRPDVLAKKNQFVIDLNPFYAFIELIRAPLLGTSPTLHNFMMTLLVTLIGILTCSMLFTHYRARIVYWL